MKINLKVGDIVTTKSTNTPRMTILEFFMNRKVYACKN